MTTEQMNRDIAVYMGYAAQKLGSKTWFEVPELGNPFTDQLKYHKSWDWLMPVWQKLRGELRVFRTNTPITNIKYVQAYDLENSIKEAITEQDTPATAHKLIHEAIQLIKQ